MKTNLTVTVKQSKLQKKNKTPFSLPAGRQADHQAHAQADQRVLPPEEADPQLPRRRRLPGRGQQERGGQQRRRGGHGGQQQQRGRERQEPGRHEGLVVGHGGAPEGAEEDEGQAGSAGGNDGGTGEGGKARNLFFQRTIVLQL